MIKEAARCDRVVTRPVGLKMSGASSFFGSFRETFVIVCDLKHFLFRCFVFYVFDQRAYFASTIAPVLKIVDSGGRHTVSYAHH